MKVGVALAAILLAAPALGMQEGEPASLTVSPEEITLTAGDTLQIQATVLDENGGEVEAEVLYLPLYGQYWNLDERTWGFNIFKVSREGEVSTRRAGEFAILVRVVGSGPDPAARNAEAEGYLEQRIPLTILPRPVASLTLSADGPHWAGTEVAVRAEPRDDTGELAEEAEVAWTSSDPAVALPVGRPLTIERTDTRAVLSLGEPGPATIAATAGAATAEMQFEVLPNPVARMTLAAERSAVRTGEVTRLEASAFDAAGEPLAGVPVGFSVAAITDAMGSGGPSAGLVTQDGRFVADLPGVYTLVARTGGVSAQTVIRVRERGVRRPIELVGHGRVKDRATSDLWVWEAPNGRDYAITGTHSAAGHAYVWEVTNPESLEIVDVVRVDARTVNDVKIAEDGAVAVISREGASNRRNGLVILDVSDPSVGIRKLAEYDDQLTGGVHNTFIHEGHIYALSGGRRFDIINIEDPSTPHRVGSFALDNPARSIQIARASCRERL